MSNRHLSSLTYFTLALALFAGIGLYSYQRFRSTLQIAEVGSLRIPVSFQPPTLATEIGVTQVATLSATFPNSGGIISGFEGILSYDPQVLEVLTVTSPSLTTQLQALSIQGGTARFTYGFTPPESREPRVCTMDFDPNNNGSCTDYTNTCRNYGNGCTRANVCAFPLHSCTNNVPDPYPLATITYRLKDTPQNSTTLTLTADSQLAATLENTNVFGGPTTHTITLTPTYLPGDLNHSGGVDLYDFNLLVINYGNPYTLYDFNNIVINYGKVK